MRRKSKQTQRSGFAAKTPRLATPRLATIKSLPHAGEVVYDINVVGAGGGQLAPAQYQLPSPSAYEPLITSSATVPGQQSPDNAPVMFVVAEQDLPLRP